MAANPSYGAGLAAFQAQVEKAYQRYVKAHTQQRAQAHKKQAAAINFKEKPKPAGRHGFPHIPVVGDVLGFAGRETKALGSDIGTMTKEFVPGIYHQAHALEGSLEQTVRHPLISPEKFSEMWRHPFRPVPGTANTPEATALAHAIVTQPLHDFRHPLRHPGFTAADALMLGSLGVGGATRLAAAGREARAYVKGLELPSETAAKKEARAAPDLHEAVQLYEGEHLTPKQQRRIIAQRRPQPRFGPMHALRTALRPFRSDEAKQVEKAAAEQAKLLKPEDFPEQDLQQPFRLDEHTFTKFTEGGGYRIYLGKRRNKGAGRPEFTAYRGTIDPETGQVFKNTLRPLPHMSTDRATTLQLMRESALDAAKGKKPEDWAISTVAERSAEQHIQEVAAEAAPELGAEGALALAHEQAQTRLGKRVTASSYKLDALRRIQKAAEGSPTGTLQATTKMGEEFRLLVEQYGSSPEKLRRKINEETKRNQRLSAKLSEQAKRAPSAAARAAEEEQALTQEQAAQRAAMTGRTVEEVQRAAGKAKNKTTKMEVPEDIFENAHQGLRTGQLSGTTALRRHLMNTHEYEPKEAGQLAAAIVERLILEGKIKPPKGYKMSTSGASYDLKILPTTGGEFGRFSNEFPTHIRTDRGFQEANPLGLDEEAVRAAASREELAAGDLPPTDAQAAAADEAAAAAEAAAKAPPVQAAGHTPVWSVDYVDPETGAMETARVPAADRLHAKAEFMRTNPGVHEDDVTVAGETKESIAAGKAAAKKQVAPEEAPAAASEQAHKPQPKGKAKAKKPAREPDLNIARFRAAAKEEREKAGVVEQERPAYTVEGEQQSFDVTSKTKGAGEMVSRGIKAGSEAEAEAIVRGQHKAAGRTVESISVKPAEKLPAPKPKAKAKPRRELPVPRSQAEKEAAASEERANQRVEEWGKEQNARAERDLETRRQKGGTHPDVREFQIRFTDGEREHTVPVLAKDAVTARRTLLRHFRGHKILGVSEKLREAAKEVNVERTAEGAVEKSAAAGHFYYDVEYIDERGVRHRMPGQARGNDPKEIRARLAKKHGWRQIELLNKRKAINSRQEMGSRLGMLRAGRIKEDFPGETEYLKNELDRTREKPVETESAEAPPPKSRTKKVAEPVVEAPGQDFTVRFRNVDTGEVGEMTVNAGDEAKARAKVRRELGPTGGRVKFEGTEVKTAPGQLVMPGTEKISRRASGASLRGQGKSPRQLKVSDRELAKIGVPPEVMKTLRNKLLPELRKEVPDLKAVRDIFRTTLGEQAGTEAYGHWFNLQQIAGSSRDVSLLNATMRAFMHPPMETHRFLADRFHDKVLPVEQVIALAKDPEAKAAELRKANGGSLPETATHRFKFPVYAEFSRAPIINWVHRMRVTMMQDAKEAIKQAEREGKQLHEIDVQNPLLKRVPTKLKKQQLEYWGGKAFNKEIDRNLEQMTRIWKDVERVFLHRDPDQLERYIQKKLDDFQEQRKKLGYLPASADTLNQMAVTMVLYLKPGYLTPNLIGQVGTVLADHFLNPVRVQENGRLAWEVSRKDPEFGSVMKAAMQNGITDLFAESGVSRRVSMTHRRLAGWYGKLLDTPFRDTSFINEARREGYNTAEEILSLKNPENLGELISIARRANRNIIDFGNMSKVEREVIRRIIFFYPWLRAASLWTLRFAVHHPAQAYTGQIAGREAQKKLHALFGNQPIPSFMEGMFQGPNINVPGFGNIAHRKVGGVDYPRLINPRSVTVQGTLGDVAGAFQSGTVGGTGQSESVASMLNPTISTLLALTQHRDPFTGAEFPGDYTQGGILAQELEQLPAGLQAWHNIQRAKEFASGKRDPATSLFPYSPAEPVARYLFGVTPQTVSKKEAISRGKADIAAQLSKHQRTIYKQQQAHQDLLTQAKTAGIPWKTLPKVVQKAFDNQTALELNRSDFQDQKGAPLNERDRFHADLSLAVRSGKITQKRARALYAKYGLDAPFVVDRADQAIVKRYFNTDAYNFIKLWLERAGQFQQYATGP